MISTNYPTLFHLWCNNNNIDSNNDSKDIIQRKGELD